MRFVASALIVTALVLLAAPVPPAGAADSQAQARVDVIEVSGIIDPVTVDFVGDALRRAVKDQAEVLVVQVSSSSTAVPQRDIDALAFQIAHADVPVAAWVGPSGSKAYGGAFQLVE